MVDLNGRSAASLALDVDGRQDGLDRQLIFRARPGSQTSRVRRIGRQFGLGHCVGENVHGIRGRDEFQGVDGDRGRVFWSWSLGQLFDQRRDLLVILGRSPSYDLSGLRAECEAGSRYDLRQKTHGVVGTARAPALHVVDHGGGRRSTGVFGVDFREDGLDRLVICRDSQRGQTLWIVGIRREG